MNRLVIIGNGFDLAHGLKTSYVDFLEWYKRDFIEYLKANFISQYDDGLCSVDFTGDENKSVMHNKLYEFDELYRDFKSINTYSIKSFNKSSFLTKIEKNYKQKGWIDIEEDYYGLLKDYIFNSHLHSPITPNDKTVTILNKQLNILKDKLVEYLQIQSNNAQISVLDTIMNKIRSVILRDKDIEVLSQDKFIEERITPNKIKILNFNYTPIAELYCKSNNIDCKYIHGNLNNSDSIIFGYGDEVDDDYKRIARCNINEYLRNFKSIKYIESSVYRDLLSFIEEDYFQILIMGHSCGNSDRTLLNTLFNHPKCVSIKPYYYINETGEDNYSDLIINISRNFNEMSVMRDRVVNKEYCETLIS